VEKRRYTFRIQYFTCIHPEEAPGCLSLLNGKYAKTIKKINDSYTTLILDNRAVPSRCLLIFANFAVNETIVHKYNFNYLITMKRLTFMIFLLNIIFASNAQKYMTKNGYIGFFSHTSLEDIKGDNNQVASILDISTGEIVFQALIKSFHFDRALMEEHFNENYMESDKFPKSSFKGKITNLSSVDFSKNGSYSVTVEGELTIHDVTNKISTKGTIEIITGGINANSKFNIVPEDYKIIIPGVVRDKIDKNLEVTVSMKYNPVTK
jgi:hypothetical protein